MKYRTGDGRRFETLDADPADELYDHLVDTYDRVHGLSDDACKAVRS